MRVVGLSLLSRAAPCNDDRHGRRPVACGSRTTPARAVASVCSLRPTCAATRPPTPTSTSSNTSVGIAAASPQMTRIANDNQTQLATGRHLRQRGKGQAGANGRRTRRPLRRRFNGGQRYQVDGERGVGSARSGNSAVAASAGRRAAAARFCVKRRRRGSQSAFCGQRGAFQCTISPCRGQLLKLRLGWPASAPAAHPGVPAACAPG